ncbi:hypothetical protein CORC01_13075 [Colletotrichum orchidophilum]|uniref:Uncharacterized protein n=1 Tax=Colletotrichum orchidophilum TaxID=1209926 RepID=A0A1G4AR55_9PEZI|nr:uncharacterized protein CORC01_13075 [Colletotrichum orchidophilum]OHE91639.1 hypothetical protein CORC01_13075 [Colletotrichum orchidophilum]
MPGRVMPPPFRLSRLFSHHISTRHPFQFPSVFFWHFALVSVRYGTPHRRLKPQSPITSPPCTARYLLLVSLSASSWRGPFVKSFPRLPGLEKPRPPSLPTVYCLTAGINNHQRHRQGQWQWQKQQRRRTAVQCNEHLFVK